jgi:hypothetical protein
VASWIHYLAMVKISPNPARNCLVITNVMDVVFGVRAFSERLGIRSRYPGENSGPIVQK